MSDLQQSFPQPRAYLVVLSGTKTSLKEKSNATDLRKHRVSVLLLYLAVLGSRSPAPLKLVLGAEGLSSLTE